MVKWHLSTPLLTCWLGEGAQGPGEGGWQRRHSSLLRWKNLIAEGISKPHGTGSCPQLSLELA